MADAIPIELFEAAMPAAMRPLIEAAKKGEGDLAWLLTDEGRRGSAVQAMLRGYPPLPVEISGWAAGISMFFRDPAYVIDIMGMHGVTAPMPFLLEALGAGLAAGVECPIETWKCIDRLSRNREMPDSMTGALAAGLVSNSSIVRKAALGVALKKPQVALAGLQAARAKKLSASQAKRLDEALAALGAGPTPVVHEKDGLLHRLVEEWGRTFDERLIAPIVAAGAAESVKRGKLAAASKGELENAWAKLALNKDPGDVDRLLSVPWPGAWKLALDRVHALGPFPRDPRIAAAVTEQAKRYTSWAGRAVGSAAGRVATNMHGLKLRDAAPELLAEAAKLTPHKVDLEELWKSFWENPGDPSRRVVLADALQSAGDARGEFISLQLAIESGTADAKAMKRADALLEQHIDSWSGALPGVQLASREFRRGFLNALKMKPPRGDHLAQSAAANEWKTVERMGIDYLWIEGLNVAALLKHMPSLRVLLFNQRLQERDLKELGGSCPGVKLIGADEWMPDVPLTDFPSLEFVCTTVRPDLALDAARRIGLKGVMFRWHSLDSALNAFESLLVHEVSELRSAPGMGRDHEPKGWTVRVTREHPERAQLFHSGRYVKGSFEALVKTLAAHGRKSLQIHCPSSLMKKLETEPQASAELSFSHLPFDVFLPPPMS